MEGESGYCRDHLEMREKDAGVLTEDRGRFGGNSRTPSQEFGPEHPLKRTCSCPPISATVRHHRGSEDTINANAAFGFTTAHKRRLTLSYKGTHLTAPSEETPTRRSRTNVQTCSDRFYATLRTTEKKTLLLCILLQKVYNSFRLPPPPK